MLQRLGFPDISRHRRFVTAIGVDAVGSGVYLPIAILYFVRTTSVGLAEVGLATSLSALAALPVVLLVGGLVDRVGAKRILLASNVIQAAGYVAYLVVDDFAGVFLAIALTAVGQSAFWGSFSPMVAAISTAQEREKWFGFVGALRNAGFAVGGLAAGVALTIGTVEAFHAVIVANIASYLLALGCLAGVRAGGPPVRPAPDLTAARAATPSGWALVARDRDFHVVVGSNLLYALCSMALNVAMPVYADQVLHLPGWVTGAIFTLNTVMCGLGQGLVVRAMSGRRRFRMVGLSNLTFGAGFALMALAGALPPAAAVGGVLVAAVIYTLGELTGGPVLSAIAVDSRSPEVRGRYLAAYQLSWNVAGILAPASFTWLLAHGWASVWLALLAVTVLGLALARVLPVRLPVAAQRIPVG